LTWQRLIQLLALVAVFAAAALPGTASAGGVDDRPLRVGTKVAPPFVVKRADGTFDGPSIQLWRELAADLQLTYSFEERDLAGLLSGLSDGTLDVSVAAITVTSDREKTVDFSHPFHTAGLAIAVRKRERSIGRTVVTMLMSSALLELVFILAVLQLVVGTLVWMFERRTNTAHFGGSTARGLFSGFWWATVTMTTVGYGDKAPVTLGGRVVALGWMLCSVVMVAAFTASAASRLTVAELETTISGPGDLARTRVAVVANTTGEKYARDSGLDFSRYARTEDALAALDEGTIDAMVHDGPLLVSQLETQPRADIIVLAPRFQRQDYAIAFPEGSDLREPVNRLLPERVRASDVSQRGLDQR